MMDVWNGIWSVPWFKWDALEDTFDLVPWFSASTWYVSGKYELGSVLCRVSPSLGLLLASWTTTEFAFLPNKNSQLFWSEKAHFYWFTKCMYIIIYDFDMLVFWLLLMVLVSYSWQCEPTKVVNIELLYWQVLSLWLGVLHRELWWWLKCIYGKQIFGVSIHLAFW